MTQPTPPKEPILSLDVAQTRFVAACEGLTADITRWMTAQGFPPDKGCLLVLPIQKKESMPWWPHFVRFSAFVQDAYLVRDPLKPLDL